MRTQPPLRPHEGGSRTSLGMASIDVHTHRPAGSRALGRTLGLPQWPPPILGRESSSLSGKPRTRGTQSTGVRSGRPAAWRKERIPRSELTYTYTTTLGKPTEEAVFETDQHGRPTALAGVAATARAALTEANRRRSRALKGLEDAFNRSLRRSQVSGLGKNHQVRWRRRDPYAVPYRDDHHPGSLCLL